MFDVQEQMTHQYPTPEKPRGSLPRAADLAAFHAQPSDGRPGKAADRLPSQDVGHLQVLVPATDAYILWLVVKSCTCP